METQCVDKIDASETMVLSIAGTQILRFDLICRICGNENEKNISIYGPDGLTNELALKINTYLPIKVSEQDSLPLNCCYTCTSTVLTWHELVVNSVEADRKLKEIPVVVNNPVVENEEIVKDEPEIILPADCYTIADASETSASLTVFYEKDGTPAEQTFLDDTFKEHEENDGTEEVDGTEEIDGTEEVDGTEETDAPKIEEDAPKTEEDVPKETYNFACEYCGTLFVTDEEILKHVRELHSNEIDLSEETQNEVPQSLEKKERRKHTKIDQEAVNVAKVVVNGKVYYNCKICGKSLYSPYTYLWHMRIHTGERPFNCELCGKQFRVSQGLARHLRETHQGIKNFGCDLCGRMFSTRRNVEEHRRIHTNERPYICDLCGKAFKQKASLFVHNRSHNNHFPFRCSYCDQGFRTKPPLLVHVTRHTGERPYPCEVCGRCFRIKYELKRHMLVHSDEKPFMCTECGLSFRQKRYLRNHNKINHNRSTE